MLSKSLPLILSFLLAGCLSSHVEDDERQTWGFGLELPAELPPAGPYLEPADEIARLEDFVRNEAVHFGECKDKPSERVEERLAAYDLKGTLEQIKRMCGIDGWDKQNASREVNETRAVVQKHVPPGTIVDTELLVYLSGSIRVVESMLEQGHYDMAGGEASMIHAIAEGYPWSEGTCVYPDFPALVNETHAKFAAILESANQSASRDAEFFAEMIVEDYRPGFERAVAEGRWWSAIGRRDVLDWDAAFIENLTAKRLPTLNETEYLLAQHRATQHTLGWEGSYINVAGVMENWRNAWEEDPWPAAKMYSMLAHGWRYGDIQCTGS